ncbi:ring-opening amidohydrolase [Candidatus Nephthysia bennettiae]|uniref:Cyclic amide hydrolase n=1 Tax=Candidatus Nephthysia bennettiae TaxID=3127016 RepID=A0A934K839_9BACT|nr:ring-opening amidohydrolase [Candidatus Dormibacteraeota bacterium]
MVSQAVDLIVCEMASPSDTSEIDNLLSKDVDPKQIVAVVGKSAGTGSHDDFGRELADLSIRESIGRHLGASRDEVAERIPIVLSGGTFGVVTPHVTLIIRQLGEYGGNANRPDKHFVVGTALSEPILPEEIGRMGQIEKVATAVRQAQAAAGIQDPADVHHVLVKAPSLSRQSIDDAYARGKDVVTRDLGAGPDGSMCYSNDGSALGVALALKEVPEESLNDGVVRRNWEIFSRVASTSSGGEKTRAEVVLLGNSSDSLSKSRIGHGIFKHLADSGGLKDALRSAGLQFDCCPSDSEKARVVQVFAKLVIPGDGRVMGHRTTLLDDRDATKCIKSTGGALVASLTGHTAVYVSGGEPNSHQGPPGGSPVAAVVSHE